VPGVAIACIRAGELAWTLGCGHADLASERLVTGDTLFNIGSISKTVAAWGALVLVERGEAELDAPIEGYVKRWRLPSSEFDARGVTLRRLLSHTAGLSLHGYPGFAPGEPLPTLEESLSGNTNGAGDVRLLHAPGTQWRYSGGGYTLAQLLIEEVSGRPFAEFMRAEVLLPLGMEHSDYRWTDEVARLAATPYGEDGEPIGGPRFTEAAAAGLQTSAAELGRFACAGLTRFWSDATPRVLKRETIELMQAPAPAAPGYGLGYEVERQGELVVVGHGGANLGWMASLRLVPASGDGIVVLTNGSNGQRVHVPLEQAWLAALQSSRPAGK
jgi:CubicO group peptidase (beta-lactamase class C family)